MSDAHDGTEPAVNRRAFCGSIAATGILAAVAIPAIASIGAETEFVIVNGWVLTRADLEDIEAPR